jgi:hypothetical protein
MTTKIKSFILFQEYKENLKLLSQSQKGDLLDAIFAFNEGEELELEPITRLAFSFIKSDLERNKTKYEKRVKNNRINGLKGGRPKNPDGLLENPKNPDGFIENPTKPNETLNDNDNDNGNGNGNDNDNGNDILNKKTLKKDFEKVFRKFNSGKNIKVIPFDKLKSRFIACLKNMTTEELENNIQYYLDYLEVATWRKKKDFAAWINDPSCYANDWLVEKEQEVKKNKIDSTERWDDL